MSTRFCQRVFLVCGEWRVKTWFWIVMQTKYLRKVSPKNLQNTGSSEPLGKTHVPKWNLCHLCVLFVHKNNTINLSQCFWCLEHDALTQSHTPPKKNKNSSGMSVVCLHRGSLTRYAAGCVRRISLWRSPRKQSNWHPCHQHQSAQECIRTVLKLMEPDKAQTFSHKTQTHTH